MWLFWAELILIETWILLIMWILCLLSQDQFCVVVQFLPCYSLWHNKPWIAILRYTVRTCVMNGIWNCYFLSLICILICFTEEIITQRDMLSTSDSFVPAFMSTVLPIAENPPTLYTTNAHHSIQKRVSATKIKSTKLD